MWPSTPPNPPTPPAPSTAPCSAAPARDAAPPSCPRGTPLPRTACDGTGHCPAPAPARRRPLRAADDPHLLGAGPPAGVRRSQALKVCAHARLSGLLLHQVPPLLHHPGRAARRPPRLAHRTGPRPRRPALVRPDDHARRRPLGTTSARATAPARSSSRPTSGITRSWNGSSRLRGAADDLIPARRPSHRGGPEASATSSTARTSGPSVPRPPTLNRHPPPGTGRDLVVSKELLCHAHISVTATVYTHVRLRLQRQAIDTLGNAPTSRPPQPSSATVAVKRL